ncbi:MAG: hypothetical protein ACTHQE_12350 [Thermomicrobiales bacterium]
MPGLPSLPGETDTGTPLAALPVNIGAPARRALAAIGVTTLEQLPAQTAAELLALHGVGPKAIRLLGDQLAERGLAFRDDAMG